MYCVLYIILVSICLEQHYYYSDLSIIVFCDFFKFFFTKCVWNWGVFSKLYFPKKSSFFFYKLGIK